MAWHRETWADPALRAAGLASIGVAVLAAMALPGAATVAANGGARFVDFGLAVLAFVGASVGSTLLLVGAHLFDRVALGPRWRRYDGLPPARVATMEETQR